MSNLKLQTEDTHAIRKLKQSEQETIGPLDRHNTSIPFTAQSLRVLKSSAAYVRYATSSNNSTHQNQQHPLRVGFHFALTENIEEYRSKPGRDHSNLNHQWWDTHDRDEVTGKWQRRWQHRAFYISVADIFRLFCYNQQHHQRKGAADHVAETRPELAEVLPLVQKVARRITNDAESPLVAPGSKANHITHDNILGFITGGGKGFALGKFQRSKKQMNHNSNVNNQSGLEAFCSQQLLEVPETIVNSLHIALRTEREQKKAQDTIARAARDVLEDFTAKMMSPTLVVQIMRYYLFGEDPSVRQRSETMFVFEEPVSVPEALEHAMQSEHLEVRQVEKMKCLLGKITKPLGKRHASAFLILNDDASDEIKFVFKKCLFTRPQPIPGFALRNCYVTHFDAIADPCFIEHCLNCDIYRKAANKALTSTRVWDQQGAEEKSVLHKHLTEYEISFAPYISCQCSCCRNPPRAIPRKDDILAFCNSQEYVTTNDVLDFLGDDDQKSRKTCAASVQEERDEYEAWLAQGNAAADSTPQAEDDDNGEDGEEEEEEHDDEEEESLSSEAPNNNLIVAALQKAFFRRDSFSSCDIVSSVSSCRSSSTNRRRRGKGKPANRRESFTSSSSQNHDDTHHSFHRVDAPSCPTALAEGSSIPSSSSSFDVVSHGSQQQQADPNNNEDWIEVEDDA